MSRTRKLKRTEQALPLTIRVPENMGAVAHALAGGPRIGVEGGVPVFGRVSDADTLKQMQTCLSDPRAAYGVLMADNHRGVSHPVGGVVAYRQSVSVTGVGVDIGCGVTAVRTALSASDLGIERGSLGRVRLAEVERIMEAVFTQVKFGIGGGTGKNAGHRIFDDPRWKVAPDISALRDLARNQLGSVGGGNHYVDLLIDTSDRVWIACHFGSRGFGAKVADGFLNVAAGREFAARAPKENDMAPPVLLDMNSFSGQDYWTAMQLAGDYAKAGREVVAAQVAGILGTSVVEVVENNHNEAWKEVHDVGRGPEELYVVRKGATPAFPGQAGFVGGSMGDDAVIVRGTGSSLSKAALQSTVHGAGRALSRTQAAGKKDWKGGGPRTGGQVTPEMVNEWLSRRGVVLRGGGTDESPQAYKRIGEVVAACNESIEVVHTLRPVGVAMAGEYDQYKR